ncbi:unnamed protein product [Cunninghamella echinulata]
MSSRKYRYIKISIISILAIILIKLFFYPNTTALSSPPYIKKTSPVRIKNYLQPQQVYSNKNKVKACIVILARNSNLYGVKASVRQFEERFNHKFQYPYIFLNEEPFTEDFKHYVNLIIGPDRKVEYGLVDKTTMWSYPNFIDQERAAKSRKIMASLDPEVPYANSESYRHMCRFQSGFFFRHPLLDPYEYYWRVEPDVDFFCDVDYDVFQMMKDNGYKYGWNIAITEIPETIPSLWNSTLKFMKKYPHYIKDSSESIMPWILNEDATGYNGCHFWSNFEIGSLEFFRSKEYIDFFNHLDNEGGFFYERWGDAPVHSIAAALMLKKDQVHFFNDIGYNHPPLLHCPTERYLQEKCHCDPERSVDWWDGSCALPYKQLDPNFIWDEKTYYEKTNPYRIHSF